VLLAICGTLDASANVLRERLTLLQIVGLALGLTASAYSPPPEAGK
jgi:hypothetical protein